MKNRRHILPITLLLIASAAILLFLLSKKAPSNSVREETIDDPTNLAASTAPYPMDSNAGPGAEIGAGDTAGDTATQNTTVPDATIQIPTIPDLTAQDSSVHETAGSASSLTKEEFFADALFIGDSRTVGLRDYAELETATFFAYSGLSSFSAFKKILNVGGVGETDLEGLLTNRSFGKIYLMLGINELGYPFSSIVSRYTQVARQIQELQPQATILLCANLRVVADGKEVRDYIANDTINQLNAEIASLADGKTFFYIDANPLFDDGNGALDPQYCSDDLHPYGKYYYQWAEWLYKIGIPKT